MKTRLSVLLLVFAGFNLQLFAQDEDLLQLLGGDKTEPQKEYVDYAFKSSRVIMSHSMEVIRPGVMDLRILHRFGNINKGAYELFGLDNASMRLGFDFGLSKNLMVGIGRSTNKKELDGFFKYRLIHQAKGKGAMPFSFLLVGGSSMTLLKFSDTSRKNYFSSRIGYYGQAIIGRKFSEGFSLQFMPTVLHRNLVASPDDPNDMLAIGVGTRVKLSRRISLNVDYYYRINPNPADQTQNPLSIGFDIETGGHVFQLHFTNAVGMNEKVFLAETQNRWDKGDIQFGFNISRSFQIKKKK
ncbi:MAG TPA: DUF5777 family beta-barrel protein [Chitinophagaceae bacterium]|nr:hypothetical protein [Chitinophagaceae bacterium]MCB9056904.1 hypothetical protein [Chitinophagales bacterium]HPG11956.1 DUF5777 family beta-barrel protein [Chitinophagaceae bacterium]